MAAPNGRSPHFPMTASPMKVRPSHDRESSLSVGLVALNAKFVHLALAPRCLRNAARAAGFENTWIAEYTVRTPPWKMAAELLARKPEVLGFSVYIWNREETFTLLELLRKQAPEVLLVVGGPEVSFESGPPSPYVDFVIGGEGEEKWIELLHLHGLGISPDEAAVARWRLHGNSAPPLEALPYLPEDMEGLAHKMVYLETSRGCPFTCAFCLSALDDRVRVYPLDTVKDTIVRLLAAGARRIKFLDRTFNLRRERVHDLLGWLMENEDVNAAPDATFHFEMVGDLLDDQTLALLDRAPPGRFQFEIGVQSTHAETQARIARRQRNDRLATAVRRLIAAGRVHLHLDLIWGLPGESLPDIRASFEEVLALRPHELQLGFLKFLPGAPIRDQIEAHGYLYQDRPPYEVIAHQALPAREVLFLKEFEEVFDAFYNSGRFRFTLTRLFQVMAPWEVFSALAGHYARQGLLVPAHGLESRARHLLECAAGWLPEAELKDLLKLDYFFHHKAHRVPDFLRNGSAGETEAVRTRRKADPSVAVAPFHHCITLTEGGALLEPSPNPLWYAFTYSGHSQGYFFRPTLERLP